MKILHFITNTELGGAQNVCINLANLAHRNGNTVAVASMAEGYLWQELDADVRRFYLRRLLKPISPIADIQCLFEFRRLVKNFDPDIIHLHSSKAGALGRLLPKKYSCRIVYTVHGFDSIRLRHRFFLPLERCLQKRCAAIVSVSHYDEKNLLSERIFHNVTTIYNGVASARTDIACPFAIAPYKKVVMTIARITAQKKFDLFLEIAADPAMQDCLFVWVGGSDQYDISEIRQRYSVPKNVLLLGNYSQASALIRYCDIFVLFSNYEGLPITIIEAMAAGKAIVASNVGGVSELVDTANGRLISDKQQAIDALQSILNNPAALESMQKASIKKYQESFTVTAMWQNYKALYRKIGTK